jgi:hypothetical protein
MLTTMTTRIGVFSLALRRCCAGRSELFGRVSALAAVVSLLAGFAHGRAEAGWDAIGPPGGTVTTILTSPVSPSTLYAGTPENGVFVSTDAGVTWTSASAGLPASTAIGRQTLYATYDLATDGQVVYAATAAGLFYTVPGATPAWAPLTSTASATPITLLAFDPNTHRLFAATSQKDEGATPGIYVAQTSANGGPPSAWTFVPLPGPAGTAVGALAIVPTAAALTPASLIVGVGNSVVTASIDLVNIGLNWVNGDGSASLAVNPVTALAYSSEFQQAYACSGGTVFYSGNPLDAQAKWSPAMVASSGTYAFSCNAFLSVPIAVGGAPQVMLGTDQGAFVSLDGVTFAATGSLGVTSSANAFAIGQSPGASVSALFVGTGYGIATTSVATLAKSVSWSASNGPASALAGGNNLRLNNANIVDSAVLGSTLYAAAVGNQYVEVLYSPDGGSSWTATHIDTALGGGEQVLSLVADNAHSVLYAATTQGLLAFSPTSARWSAVTAGTFVGRVGALALGTNAIFVGTDDGLYAVPLSGAPDTALPVAAGLTGASVRTLLVTGGALYAGTIDSNDSNIVYTASEAGATAGTAVWSQFGISPTGTDRITSLLLVGDSLLAATNGGLVLYASADSGWASANTNPDPEQQISDAFGAINSLYSDGTSIYAATGSNGIFVSPAGGAFSWTPFNGSGTSALPSMEVHTLHANGSTLYAATRGGIAAFAGLSGSSTPKTPALLPMPSGSGGGATDPLFVLLLLIGVAAIVAARQRR